MGWDGMDGMGWDGMGREVGHPTRRVDGWVSGDGVGSLSDLNMHIPIQPSHSNDWLTYGMTWYDV